MKLSTFLLSSAALVVAGSAYAADLPAKKGAPAAKAALAGCPAFGAGFFQIPGGDTCLKISGYMRYTATNASPDSGATNSSLTQTGNYGLVFDARSNSDLGVIRGVTNLEDNATSDAYVQFANLTAGKHASMMDIAPTSAPLFGAGLGGGSDIGVKYSIAAGGATVSLGAYQAANNNIVATGVADQPDIMLGVSTTLGAVAFNLVGATHQVESTTGTKTGTAVNASAVVSFGAGKAYLYGGSSSGALLHTGRLNSLADSTAAANDLSTGASFGGGVNIGVGTGSLELNAIQITNTRTTTKNSSDRYSVSYAISPVKGLTIIPEIYTTAVDNAGDKSNTQSAYIRITRDF